MNINDFPALPGCWKMGLSKVEEAVEVVNGTAKLQLDISELAVTNGSEALIAKEEQESVDKARGGGDKRAPPTLKLREEISSHNKSSGNRLA